MSSNEMYIRMTETKISRLIPRLAIPTIITMLVTSIYNMADTFFVSQIGTSASAAVGINFSLMAMIQAIGFTLGMGSGNYVSRSLGRQDSDGAHRAAATAFFTAMTLGAILAILGLLFLDEFVNMLGATPTIAPYAKDYAKYILIATPYMCCAFVLNNLHRSQGNAFYSMLGLATGGILNMILDPILIFKFNMGISGAAIATIFSQFVSFSILLFMSQRNKKNVTIKLSKFTFKLWVYKEILKAGLPTLSRQGLASMAAVALNVCASPFGDAAIAAMSITVRIMMFINSSLLGFGQGFQPVCGFNYGAKKYHRVKYTYILANKAGAIISIIAFILFQLFPMEIISLFGSGTEEYYQFATKFFRIFLFFICINFIQPITSTFFTSIGKPIKGIFLSLTRQIIYLLPLIIILPLFFGIDGIIFACPAVNFIAAITCLITISIEFKNMKQLELVEEHQNIHL